VRGMRNGLRGALHPPGSKGTNWADTTMFSRKTIVCQHREKIGGREGSGISARKNPKSEQEKDKC